MANEEATQLTLDEQLYAYEHGDEADNADETTETSQTTEN